MAHSYDVAVVGAGPNGLTAAAYLARAGADVVVLERRFERGGTFASDDYSTPFLYNQAQVLLPLGAESPPYRELELHGYGVAFVEPATAMQVRAGGADVLVGRGGTGLGAEVEAMFAAVSRAVAPMLYAPPEDEAGVVARLAGGDDADAARLARLTVAELTDLADGEAGRVAVRYACAMAGFPDASQRLGLVGGFCVARLFSPILVAGGTKNLANALFRVAAHYGATCHVSSPVRRIVRSTGQLRVECGNGLTVAARTVVSTLDPRTTFTELFDVGDVPTELAIAASGWVFDEVAPFIAHYGVKGPPPAPADPGRGEAAVRIVGFDTLADLDRHLAAVRAGALPERPAGDLMVTTAHDPSQASPGPYGPLHTLRFGTFAPTRHPAGTWDRLRPAYRTQCWRFLTEAVPELGTATLLARFADAPGDLHRRFATTRGGTVRQGALLPQQTFDRRPHPACASSRTPVDGLYLGGGGVHPGVPGSLGGGYRVARVVCEDLGLGH